MICGFMSVINVSKFSAIIPPTISSVFSPSLMYQYHLYFFKLPHCS